MPGFNVGQGETIGERVKKGAAERVIVADERSGTRAIVVRPAGPW